MSAVRTVDSSIRLDGGSAVTLFGSRCADCDEVHYRPSPLCPNCGSASTTETPLGRVGVLWSYTVCHNRPPGSARPLDSPLPFVLGLVELPEGVRVLAPIEGAYEKLDIGVTVQLRPLELMGADGEELIGFAFSAEDPEVRK